MQSISIGYGKANFATKSGTWVTMGLKKNGTKPYIAHALNAVYGKKPYRIGRYPCGEWESHGAMYQESLENIPDNVMVLAKVDVKSRGFPLRNGAIYIRTRANGPSLIVKAKMLVDSKAHLVDNFALFIGRGDILTIEEVEAEFVVPPYIKKLYRNPVELSECFEITQLEAPFEPPPKVAKLTDLSGETKEVVIQETLSRKVTRKKLW